MTGAEISSVIDRLSDELQLPAENLIKAYSVAGYGNFAAAVIGCAAFLFGMFTITQKMKVCEDRCEKEALAVLGSVFSMATMGCFAIMLFEIPGLSIWLESPEAYGIQKLLRVIF